MKLLYLCVYTIYLARKPRLAIAKTNRLISWVVVRVLCESDTILQQSVTPCRFGFLCTLSIYMEVWVVLTSLSMEQKRNSLAWDRERTISTERPPLVGEVGAKFCGSRVPRGQRDGSPRPYSRPPRPGYYFFERKIKFCLNLNIL
jgi:hypothetical protein